MTDEEFAAFRSAQYDMFKVIGDFVGFELQDRAGYHSALITVLVYSADIERAMEAIGWFAFFVKNEDHSILDAIYDGHATPIYLSTINSMYYGYRGHMGSSITQVSIGSKITSIGAECFLGCTQLTAVDGGSRLQEVGPYAFDGCTALSDTILSELEQLLYIGEYAFRNAFTRTVSLVVPNHIRFIGNGAFYGCNNLKEITLPFVGESRNASRPENAVFGHIFGRVSYRTGETR